MQKMHVPVVDANYWLAILLASVLTTALFVAVAALRHRRVGAAGAGWSPAR